MEEQRNGRDEIHIGILSLIFTERKLSETVFVFKNCRNCWNSEFIYNDIKFVFSEESLLMRFRDIG